MNKADKIPSAELVLRFSFLFFLSFFLVKNAFPKNHLPSIPSIGQDLITSNFEVSLTSKPIELDATSVLQKSLYAKLNIPNYVNSATYLFESSHQVCIITSNIPLRTKVFIWRSHLFEQPLLR